MSDVSYLIRKAQNHDEQAMVDLIQKFEPKLKSTVYAYAHPNKSDYEDMEQELVIKLIEGVQKFDIEHVPGFWEYLGCVERKEIS